MQIVFMETIYMKCQILFSGKNKKNIANLSSAEFAQRVVKVRKVVNKVKEIMLLIFLFQTAERPPNGKWSSTSPGAQRPGQSDIRPRVPHSEPSPVSSRPEMWGKCVSAMHG